MRFPIHAALGLLLGLTGAAAEAYGPSLNLAEYARITATSVREQQNPGWIFDEADGPGTVRDGDAATGWAPAAGSPQRLMLDFAFINPAPFELREVTLQWGKAPAGQLNLWFGDDPDALQRVASAEGGATRLTPEGRPRGRYLALELTEPGPDTRLVELGVRAAGAQPEPPEITVKPAADGALRLRWSAVDPRQVHHIEIHRSRDAGFTPSAASRLAVALDGPVTVLPPRAEGPVGLELAVVAVGFDGRAAVASRRPVQTARPAGEAAFRLRGVIEGFYGRPWPHRQRLAMIRTLGNQGFNFYAYAPKDSPSHRAAWREPLTQAQLDRFAELLAAGVRHGVRVAYSLSPGLSLDPNSEDDLRALTAKLDPLIDIGYHDFGLLFDDIPVQPDRETGATHVRFTTRLDSYLRSRLGPGASLFFVPTVYSGQAESLDAGQRAYLERLADLPDDVPVAWTGPRVFSREIRADQARAIRALMGGQPLIVWDNYPVNDAGSRRDLYLGAIRAREVGLAEVVQGVLINPMVQGAASRIPIRAYGDLLHQPAEYDARASFERAITAEAAGGDRACLANLCDYFTGSGRVETHAEDATRLRHDVDAFVALAGGPPGAERTEAALALARTLGQAWRSETCLATGLRDLDLVDDLLPAARAVSRVGADGLDALQLVMLRRRGLRDAEAERRLQAARRAQQRALWRVGDGTGKRWLEAALAVPVAPRDDGAAPAPRLQIEPPAEAWVGEPCSFDVRLDPPASDARFHLVGPEGMRIDGMGRVTWTPRRSGPGRALVIAASPSGLDLAHVELRVKAPPYRPAIAGDAALRLGASALVVLAVLAVLAAAWRRHGRASSQAHRALDSPPGRK